MMSRGERPDNRACGDRRRGRHKPGLWPLGGPPSDGVRFDEVQEDAGRRRERPTPVIDEVEMPREAEAPDGDGPQLLGIQFALDGQPREERDPEAALDGILDGRVAAELE